MSDSCFYDDDDEFWKEMDEHEREEDTVIDPRRPRKIEPDPQKPQYIKTVWGKGYRFEDATVD